jgi:hypothetical protein
LLITKRHPSPSTSSNQQHLCIAAYNILCTYWQAFLRKGYLKGIFLAEMTPIGSSSSSGTNVQVGDPSNFSLNHLITTPSSTAWLSTSAPPSSSLSTLSISLQQQQQLLLLQYELEQKQQLSQLQQQQQQQMLSDATAAAGTTTTLSSIIEINELESNRQHTQQAPDTSRLQQKPSLKRSNTEDSEDDNLVMDSTSTTSMSLSTTKAIPIETRRSSISCGTGHSMKPFGAAMLSRRGSLPVSIPPNFQRHGSQQASSSLSISASDNVPTEPGSDRPFNKKRSKSDAPPPLTNIVPGTETTRALPEGAVIARSTGNERFPSDEAMNRFKTALGTVISGSTRRRMSIPDLMLMDATGKKPGPDSPICSTPSYPWSTHNLPPSTNAGTTSNVPVIPPSSLASFEKAEPISANSLSAAINAARTTLSIVTGKSGIAKDIKHDSNFSNYRTPAPTVPSSAVSEKYDEMDKVLRSQKRDVSPASSVASVDTVYLSLNTAALSQAAPMSSDNELLSPVMQNMTTMMVSLGNEADQNGSSVTTSKNVVSEGEKLPVDGNRVVPNKTQNAKQLAANKDVDAVGDQNTLMDLEWFNSDVGQSLLEIVGAIEDDNGDSLLSRQPSALVATSSAAPTDLLPQTLSSTLSSSLTASLSSSLNTRHQQADNGYQSAEEFYESIMDLDDLLGPPTAPLSDNSTLLPPEISLGMIDNDSSTTFFGPFDLGTTDDTAPSSILLPELGGLGSLVTPPREFKPPVSVSDKRLRDLMITGATITKASPQPRFHSAPHLSTGVVLPLPNSPPPSPATHNQHPSQIQSHFILQHPQEHRQHHHFLPHVPPHLYSSPYFPGGMPPTLLAHPNPYGVAHNQAWVANTYQQQLQLANHQLQLQHLQLQQQILQHDQQQQKISGGAPSSTTEGSLPWMA